jgi:dolichyl-diphosphooligosaccharide--protein glycosyltransferase
VRRLGLLARCLVVYAVALILRLRNIRDVLVDGKVLLGYDDPYYHLRRVLLTLADFPNVPSFDSYTNFPEGARITWPPGFDLLVSAICWIAGLGDPSPHRAEAVAALIVPFLGAITAVLVMLLAEEILGRGRWEAFAAGILFGFLPAQQAVSTVGRLDHHVVEGIALGAAVLFFLRAIRDDPGSRYSFWGGIAIALGTFCWTGSTIYAGFLVGFAVLQMILDRLAGRGDEGTGRSALRVLFWAWLLLIPLVLVAPGDGRRSFTFLYLSWYQPVLIGAGALLVAALSGAIFAPGDPKGRVRAIRGLLLSGLVAIAGVFLLVRGAGGVEFLIRRDPVIALLRESVPAWKLPPGQILEYFSHLILLAPLAGAALLVGIARARFGDVRLNALAALLLFTGALGAGQARFLNYFAVPFCILILWAFRAVIESTRERIAGRAARWGVVAAGFALLAVPLGPTLRASIHSLPGNVDLTPGLPELYPSLEWMRENTPKTSHLLEPSERPEYGVLADFSFGHWITAIAERPNFCNPFSLAPWHEGPIVESARLFLAEDGEEAAARMEKLRLRYVLLFNSENAIPDYARLAGTPVEDFLVVSGNGREATPTIRFFHTLAVRLALADGGEFEAYRQVVPALERFRLIHESREARNRVVPGLGGPFAAALVKIFERVPGVRIEGRDQPGSEVVVQVPLQTDTGRRLEFLARTRAGADGTFRLRVPYSEGANGGTTAGPARIATSRCEGEIRAAEEQVLEAARVEFRCPARDARR